MHVSLKPATAADLPLISALAERIWHEHYTPIIGEKQVQYMLEKMYSEKSLREQMNEGQQFFLAYEGEHALGYVALSTKDGNEFFMHKFYLEVQQQGRGFGKQIFAELLSRFPNLQTMRLQVNRLNYKSINFYFRVGFTIEEAKNFDIGDGYSMDDYVMLYKRR